MYLHDANNFPGNSGLEEQKTGSSELAVSAPYLPTACAALAGGFMAALAACSRMGMRGFIGNCQVGNILLLRFE